MSWFRYERSMGRWCPVVIYGDRPTTPKGEEQRFTAAVHVPPDCLDSSGEPMFGRLQAIFPAPVEAVQA